MAGWPASARQTRAPKLPYPPITTTRMESSRRELGRILTGEAIGGEPLYNRRISLTRLQADARHQRSNPARFRDGPALRCRVARRPRAAARARARPRARGLRGAGAPLP